MPAIQTLDILCDDLDITVRARNALRFNRINTVRELVSFTAIELIAKPRILYKTLDELVRVLNRLGLSLGQNDANAT